MAALLWILALIPFYLLGAAPAGYLIALSRGVDILSRGSGNVGAANVARCLGFGAGFLTLGLDAGKGFAASALAALVSGRADFAAAAAFASVAGHCFSIPGKLRGGKGVATALGAFLYLDPGPALAALAVFAAAALLWRIASLASLSAAISAPIFAFLLGTNEHASIAMIAAAALISVRHKDNIIRLTQGLEPKFGKELFKKRSG